MKAAIVTGPNQTPIYGDFKDPAPQPGQELITVAASALSNFAKARASGEHFSATGQYPLVAGVDGVGTNEKGQRLYFLLPTAPFGAMAKKVLVKSENCFPLPEGLDDVTAAAIANPGLSSIAALKQRAALQPGETVLINGATGSAGKLAVQIAKYLGAKKIIATGRDAATLEKTKELGAEVTINLTLEPKALEESFAAQFRGNGVNVILDYLYGPSTEILLTALAKNNQGLKPIRYVEIGAIGSQNIQLPGVLLRAAPLTMMGSGLGSVSMKDFLAAAQDVMQAVVPGKLKIETTVIPLADVEKTWNGNYGKSRLVYVVK
jgi:NADPH:quinone reductase-like Zn-dependent oxidoreductase